MTAIVYSMTFQVLHLMTKETPEYEIILLALMETALELVTIPVQAVEPAVHQAAQALAQVLQASIM